VINAENKMAKLSKPSC